MVSNVQIRRRGMFSLNCNSGLVDHWQYWASTENTGKHIRLFIFSFIARYDELSEAARMQYWAIIPEEDEEMIEIDEEQIEDAESLVFLTIQFRDSIGVVFSLA